MAKLGDDFELPLGEDGSVKGSELKNYLGSVKGDIETRDKSLAELRAENASLKKYQADTATLFEAAARSAAAEGNNPPPIDPRMRQQSPVSDEDEEINALMSDPLYAPIAKKLMPRLLKNFESQLEERFKPQFETITKQNQMVTQALLQQQTAQNFRDAGEWPEGVTLNKVVEYARERRYFVPGGEQWGLVDVNRVHQDLMTPIQRQREIDTIRKEAKEEALREFRSAPNVIAMPNREMGGNGKRLTAKGRTPDEIFGNSMNEASQDLATQRLLAGIKG